MKKNKRQISRDLNWENKSMPAAKQLDLPASRVQFFLRARSESGRFFLFSVAKASEPERELPSGTNYRNRK